MIGPLPPRTPRQAESVSRTWLAMAELALDLAEYVPEAVRLSALNGAPDGYGAGSGERGGSGSISDPTAAAVEQAQIWEPDQVAQLVEHLWRLTGEMQSRGTHLAGVLRLIRRRGDCRAGRQSSLTDCLACGRSVSGVGDDRVRAGYCRACWQAWLRYRVSEARAGREASHEAFRRRRSRHLQAMAQGRTHDVV